MKYLYITICLLALSFTTVSFGQIGGSVFDVVNDATKKAKGESDDKAIADKEAQDLENFKKGLGVFSEELAKVGNTPMIENCLDIMVNHGYQLFKHQGLVVRARNCKVKKELLEAQALNLLSAGTKFFCPDELYSDPIKYGEEIIAFFEPYANEKSPSEGNATTDKAAELMRRHRLTGGAFGNPYQLSLEGLRDGLIEYLNDIEDMGYAENEDVWVDIANERGKRYELALTYLIHYFSYYLSPKFIAKRTEEINAEIRELSCD